MSLNKPVDQSWPNGLLDSLLSIHVVGVDIPFWFVLKHVVLDFGTELRDLVNIVYCAPVALWKGAKDLVLPSMLENLLLMVQLDVG